MRASSALMSTESAAAQTCETSSTAFRTTDPLEARLRTQQFLNCSHRMTVLERETPFLARVEYTSVGALGLMSSVYGPAVQIGCSPPIDLVTVNFLYGGRLLINDGGVTAHADPEHAAAFCFEDDLEMWWTPGLRQLMLTIEKPRVERYLRDLLHEPVHEPLRFETEVDLAGSGQAIAGAVAVLRQTLANCGKVGLSPVLASEMEHAVLTALVFGQRHNYSDAIFSAPSLPSPRVVRKVVEFIDSSPETAFSIADLAAIAGVSERSLHAAFRRHTGTSPMAYVRRRRLEQAHEELVRLEPVSGVTVTDVALRHGFAHGGRFAAAYRARFGESPSVTLRR